MKIIKEEEIQKRCNKFNNVHVLFSRPWSCRFSRWSVRAAATACRAGSTERSGGWTCRADDPSGSPAAARQLAAGCGSKAAASEEPCWGNASVFWSLSFCFRDLFIVYTLFKGAVQHFWQYAEKLISLSSVQEVETQLPAFLKLVNWDAIFNLLHSYKYTTVKMTWALRMLG